MNFDKLLEWVFALVFAAACTSELPRLQAWVWSTQARFLAKSQTKTWGTPRFFNDQASPTALPKGAK